MLLNGKKSSLKSHKKEAYFFLDECLPHQIGDYLHALEYPIISWYQEFNGQQGWKDTPLIQYLGGKFYSWITKDDAAKAEHEKDIRAAGISVIWVRGLERVKGNPKKNKVSGKDINRMLTDKLEYLQKEISSSNHARYYMLSVKSGYHGDHIPVARNITLEYFFKEHLPKLN